MNLIQAQSFATATAVFQTSDFLPYVVVYMKKGSKSVTIPATLVDTGAVGSVFDAEFAKELGIDLKKGVPGVSVAVNQRCNSSTVLVESLQVSTLKPINNVKVTFVDAPCKKRILGWKGILQHVKLELSGGIKTPKLTYSELAQAAMANASAYFRSRI